MVLKKKTRKTKQTKGKGTLKLITFFWVGLLIFSLLNIFLIVKLNKNIDIEREVYTDKVEMVSLAYLLKSKSDFLTSEARNFAVTANPKHLMNYWDEVDVKRGRDFAVSRLEQLSAKKEEIALMELSKRNSDALVLTEMHSMKLVLDAYSVPIQLMPVHVQKYILPEYEKKMTSNEKLLLAQEILFNKKYYDDKKLIMGPATEFKNKLIARKNQEISSNKNTVGSYILALFIGIPTISILIFCIIWIRVLYLK